MPSETKRRGGLPWLVVGLLLIAVGLLTATGCGTVNGATVTDADRAAVAADLAFVSIADRPTVWQPADDVTPTPQPVTPSRLVPITNTAAKVEAIEATAAGSCADGSCGIRDGDRRRPVAAIVGATGQVAGTLGRGVIRGRPIRRVGGFLFGR